MRPANTSSSPHNRGKQRNNVMSKVPRWGAMTFEEQVENHMMLNQMKNIHAKPQKKNFLKLNIRQTRETTKMATMAPQQLSLSASSVKQRQETLIRDLKERNELSRETLAQRLEQKE